MLYLANPSTALIRAQITSGMLGALLSPRQGNRLLPAGLFGVDNGCGPKQDGQPGTSYPGDVKYLGWLARLADAEGAERCDPDTSRCLFAVAPDVLCDAEGTLARSQYMLPMIREVGFPAALVAQDGLERLRVPWDDFDVLFIGGSTAWKLGAASRALITQAHDHGKWVHLGRVNSQRRTQWALYTACDSADGTTLTRGPDVNLPRVLGWQRFADTQIPLWPDGE
jgi:hypothetical protein